MVAAASASSRKGIPRRQVSYPEEALEHKVVMEGVSDDIGIVHRKRSQERDLSNQEGKTYQEDATKGTDSNIESDPPVSTKQIDLVKVPAPCASHNKGTVDDERTMPLGAYVAALALFSHVSSQIVSRTAAEHPQNRLGSAAAPPAQRALVHTPAPHWFRPGMNMLSRHD